MIFRVLVERFALDAFPALRDMKFPLRGIVSGRIRGRGGFESPDVTAELNLLNVDRKSTRLNSSHT